MQEPADSSQSCPQLSYMISAVIDTMDHLIQKYYSPPLLAQMDVCRPGQGTGIPAPWLQFMYQQPLFSKQTQQAKKLKKHDCTLHG